MVELRVRDEAQEILVYTFKSAGEAGEMIQFLTEFFPDATFLVQPLTH